MPKNIRRPGNPWRFMPGKGGKGRGRAKGSKDISTWLKAMMNEKIQDEDGTVKPGSRIFAEKLMFRALSGDVRAAELVLDRVEGKVTTVVENTGVSPTQAISFSITEAQPLLKIAPKELVNDTNNRLSLTSTTDAIPTEPSQGSAL